MSIPAPFTDKQIADQITRDGHYWYGNNGDMTVSYSFSSDLGTWWDNDSEYALNATQQQWVVTALDHLSDMFGFNFVETNSVPSTPTDVIQFVNDSNTGTYSSSYFSTGGSNANGHLFNAVVFDDTWSSNQAANLEYGSFGYMTMLHEILHSLGLEHPGEYNAVSGQTITYQDHAEFQQDTHRYTVMSYFRSYEDGSNAVHYDTVANEFVYPRTAMVYDILAMTSGSFDGNFGGYGFNNTTRNTNTTYGHNASAGIDEAYDFDAHGAPVLTIYDTGGVDTLDLSGDSVGSRRVANYDANGNIQNFSNTTRTDTLIDLREGQYSSTHGMTFNIGIAFGTVIENAIGTGFADTFHGNGANNILTGNGGADVFFGYGGSNTFLGGAGSDTAAYDASAERYDFGLSGGGVFTIVDTASGNATDTLNSIENVQFQGVSFDVDLGSAVANVMNGTSAGDLLIGGGGNDTLNGANGADIVEAGSGQDRVFASAGFDVVDGGDDVDVFDLSSQTGGMNWVNLGVASGQYRVDAGAGFALRGSLSNVENVSGSAASDLVYGDNADNTYFYTAGLDTFDGNGGFDTFDTSAMTSGFQWIDLQASSSQLRSNDGSGWIANAVISDVERFVTTDDTDHFRGNSSGQTLVYAGGRDFVDGRAGTDTLEMSGYDDGVWVNLNIAFDQFRFWNGAGYQSGGNLANVEAVIGAQGNDFFFADSTDNFFFGGLGDDRFEGAGGTDTFEVDGVLADYTLSGGGSTFTLAGASGTDTLIDVEFVKIGDTTYDVASLDALV